MSTTSPVTILPPFQIVRACIVPPHAAPANSVSGRCSLFCLRSVLWHLNFFGFSGDETGAFLQHSGCSKEFSHEVPSAAIASSTYKWPCQRGIAYFATLSVNSCGYVDDSAGASHEKPWRSCHRGRSSEQKETILLTQSCKT